MLQASSAVRTRSNGGGNCLSKRELYNSLIANIHFSTLCSTLCSNSAIASSAPIFQGETDCKVSSSLVLSSTCCSSSNCLIKQLMLVLGIKVEQRTHPGLALPSVLLNS